MLIRGPSFEKGCLDVEDGDETAAADVVVEADVVAVLVALWAARAIVAARVRNRDIDVRSCSFFCGWRENGVAGYLRSVVWMRQMGLTKRVRDKCMRSWTLR